MCSYVAPAVLKMYIHSIIASRRSTLAIHWPSPLTHQDAARITQGLLLTSSPMAKSQKKPGGQRPKIAIAMVLGRKADCARRTFLT